MIHLYDQGVYLVKGKDVVGADEAPRVLNKKYGIRTSKKEALIRKYGPVED